METVKCKIDVLAKGDFSFCEIPAAVNDFLKGIGMAIGISTDKDGTFELIIKQASKAQF